MTLKPSVLERLNALEAAQPHDSFVVAVQSEPQDVGAEWVQLSGFELGPQNFDNRRGPDLRISDDGDAIEVVRSGRYAMSINCQILDGTADGWFEPAIEPNGLSLSEDLWPTEIAQGHVGIYVPISMLQFDPPPAMGAQAGYTAPRLLAGATITGWARFASAAGEDSVSVSSILYATRVTS